MSPYPAVVGVDPSLTSTGVCRIIGTSATLHRVRSKVAKDSTLDDDCDRIAAIVDGVMEHVPDGSLFVIESPAFSSSTGKAHDRAGLWWALVFSARAKGCEVIRVSIAQRMTYAVGKGGGPGTDKDNVLAAVIRRYPTLDITGNDVADGVVFAAIGKRLTGEPIDRLPRSHVRALDKLPRIRHDARC